MWERKGTKRLFAICSHCLPPRPIMQEIAKKGNPPGPVALGG